MAGGFYEIAFNGTKWACSEQGKGDGVLYKTGHNKAMESAWIYTHTLLIRQQGDMQADSKQAI